MGSTLSVILNIPDWIAIPVSAGLAIGYTFFGGLLSVAYTDVAQLSCIIVGLLLCIPFAATHPSVDSLHSVTAKEWFGSIETQNIATYIDNYLLLIFGGIPWQAYFQRVLSSRSPQFAKLLSLVGGVSCAVLTIPSVVIGGIAKSAGKL